jgi:hypothetical protein
MVSVAVAILPISCYSSKIKSDTQRIASILFWRAETEILQLPR